MQVTKETVAALLAPQRISRPPVLSVLPAFTKQVTAVVVTNPLGWLINSTITMPVPTATVSVTNDAGFVVDAEISYDELTAQHILRFHADSPPLGLGVFFVRSDHPDRMMVAPRVISEEHVSDGEEGPTFTIGSPERMELTLDDQTGKITQLEFNRAAAQIDPKHQIKVGFTCELSVADVSSNDFEKLTGHEETVVISRGQVSHAVTRTIKAPEANPGLTVEHVSRVLTATAKENPLSSVVEMEFTMTGLGEEEAVVLEINTDLDTGGFFYHDEGGAVCIIGVMYI